MRTSRYPEYRDSGIEWIGAIPGHWERVPFFAAAREHREKNIAMKEDNLLSLSYGNIVRKDMTSNDGLLPESFETYQVVGPSDLVFRLTDLQNDKRSLRSAIVIERGIITSAYLAVTPIRHLPKYFAYLMRTYDLQKVFYSMGGGLRQSMKFEDMKHLPLVLPPLDEQHQIVDYLDAQTAKIDALIGKQERLIEALAERRQAVISRAVTKGLDPNATMKDSGGEWLGSIPASWTATRLKYVATVQTGLTLGNAVAQADAIELPYLRVANVQTSGVNLDEVKTVLVGRGEWTKYRLRDGDVLMTEGGDIDKLGRGCIWSNQIDPCVHQNHVFAVRCGVQIDSHLLVYLLDAQVARNYFRMTAKKTTNLASTNSTTLGNLPLALPEVPEQARVVEYLDRETSQIDKLAAKAREMIVVLRERRQALINAAVTGKIDVREPA